MILKIDNVKQFEEEITSGITLVDFYADWCGPCKMMSPILEMIDGDKEFDYLKIIKVDTEIANELSLKYNIKSLPTFIIFKDGKAVNVKVGAMPDTKLKELINSATSN